MRSAAIFVALAAVGRVVLAQTPPACLIAAVGVQENPADVKALCGTLEDAMIGNITEWCTDAVKEEEALDVYVDTCKAIGVTITLPEPETTTTSGAGPSKTGSTNNSDDDEDADEDTDGSGSGSGSGSATDGDDTTSTDDEDDTVPTGAAGTLSTNLILSSIIGLTVLASQLLV